MQSATADRVKRLHIEVPRKALTGDEAGRILEASEDGKNLRDSTVIVTFKDGRVVAADVNKHHSRK